MICRLYESADAPSLDLLLNHNRNGEVRLGLDRIVVAGESGRPAGVLVWRPCALVHELRLAPVLGQRTIARSLVDFARRDAKLSGPFPIREALFLIDGNNTAMQLWLQEAESNLTEEKGRVFCVPV